MNNKNILRIALPFIIIFFISVAIAVYTYIQKNLSDAKAGDEALNVTAVNVKNPLSTNDIWEWKLVGQTDRAPNSPILLTYTADWCLNHKSTDPCIKDVSQDFFYQIGTGTVTINAKDTAAKISHQSVNCGRVDLEIFRDGQAISRSSHSTSTECTKNLSESVGAYAETPADFALLINQILNMLLGMWDEDESNDGDSPVVENPGTPGDPGGIPPDQVCRPGQVECNEVYREACGEGDQAGSRVCHKYGVCSGPGSGVQCSWGPGSVCERCEPGRPVSDPVPPIKPPEGPPGDPGNPPGGGDPEPMPIPADADAQKAVALGDFLYSNKECMFTVAGSKVPGMITQYNVGKCLIGSIGTNNDAQAKAEVDYSARNIGAGQRRNGTTIGYNHLQCVGFVEGAVAAASGRDYNGPTGNAQARCRNAGNYTCVRVGNNFSRVSQETPRPNDLAVWEVSSWGPFGHVAYVVSSTPGSFTVVEANNSCVGCVRRFTYTLGSEIANHNLAGFLRRN